MYPATVRFSFKANKTDRELVAHSQAEILSVLAEVGLDNIKDLTIRPLSGCTT